jgi:hypothetical protein
MTATRQGGNLTIQVMCLLLLILLAQNGEGRVKGQNAVRYRRRDQENNNDGDDDFSYPESNSQLETCDDEIVQVKSLSVLCDSPYTFYYGNGANRNSQTCNYGDKATITVYFEVTDDLDDTNIYMVMSVYAGYGNEVLTSTSPKNLKK